MQIVSFYVPGSFENAVARINAAHVAMVLVQIAPAVGGGHNVVLRVTDATAKRMLDDARREQIKDEHRTGLDG